MRELVEFLVRALVEQPDKVEVEEFEEDGDLVLEVSVAEDDLGRVIGKGGRIANDPHRRPRRRRPRRPPGHRRHPRLKLPASVVEALLAMKRTTGL